MTDEFVVAQILLNITRRGEQAIRDTAAEIQALSASTQESDARMAAAATVASTAMIGIGGVTLLAGGAAVKFASDFEASMERVSTQAGASQAEVDALKNKILDLSATTATGPDQLAQSLYHVESAGIRGAQALDTVKAAAEGAKIGGADLEATTQAMIAATVSHIAGIHGQIDAMAQLNAVVGTGDTRMQDLAQAMSTGVLAAAHNFGLAFKDVGAALATLTDNAMPAEEAATRLRMAIALMGAPSSKAAQELATIGLSTTQLATDMRKNDGLLLALEDLKQHLESSGKTAEQQAQIISQAFGGGRSGVAVELLIQQLDRLKSKYQEQSQLVGQFGEDWKKTQATAAYAFSQLEADTQALGISIGSALLPPLDALEHTIAPLIADASKWAQANQGVVEAATAAGLAIGTLGVAFKAAQFAAAPLVLAFGGIRAALAAVMGTAPPAATAIAATGEAAAAATPEIIGYDAALGALVAESSGLIVPLSALPVELEATGVAAAGATDAVGAGGLAGAFGLLMNPEIAIPAAVIAGGIFAYETMPAVKNAANEAAHTIGTDLTGALYLAESGFNAARTVMGQQTVDTKSASAAASDLAGSWLKLSTNLGDMIPGFRSVHDAADFLNQAMANEVKQHDAAAAAADRHAAALKKVAEGMTMDATRGHGGIAEGSGSAAPSLPVLPENVQAAEFVGTFKQATAANNEAMAAFVNALRTGQQNVGEMAQKAAQTTTALDQMKQEQINAALQIDLMMGQADAGVQNFVSSLNSKATDSLELFAIGMQRGSRNLTQLEASAIAAGKANQEYSKNLAEATKIVDHALGVPDPAAQKLATSLEKAASAGVDFASKITKAATDTTAKLAEGIFKGDAGGKLDHLTAAAAKAEAAHLHMAGSTEAAQLRVAKAAGDWATVLSITQKEMQDAVNKAVGKYVADKASGNVAALPADRAAVNEAENRLKALNKEISNLEGKAKVLSTSFQDLADKATAGLNTALDHLEKGLLDSGGKMTPAVELLAEKADKAQAAVSHYAAIHDQAAAIVLRAAGTIAQRFDALSSDLSTKAKSALDAFILGMLAHDTPTKLRELGDAAQRAAAAAAKFAEVQLQAAERVGTPSQRLSAREQDEQGKLSNAEAKITLAIEDHERVTKADIAAAQEHERAVQRDTQAQWDAAFAAASVSERHAMLAQQASGLISRFQTLQSATQSVTDAQMAYSADQSNILKIRLDNLSKAYEDATAIFQARNAAIKDQGTAGVTAVTDTSGILKAQSDILQAILQVGLSSKAESAATAMQAIQVANDQLAVARDQESIDQAAAAAQQKIDADNVKIAEDRAALDRVQGGMTMAVAFQQLQLDHDKIQLAKDQLKLTALTNQGISLIASHFGETKGYDDKIRAVLTTIEGDNAQINADLKGAQSENAQWQTLMYNATKQVDQDTRQLATDQASSDAGSASGQRRIAVDQQLVQADQAYLQDLQAVDQATQSVTDAFNQLASDQSKAVVDSLNAMVTAVNDATAVLQAVSGVSKASEDGQIKAVQDQSAIIKAEGDIAAAKSSAQLAVARDELTIAEDTLTMDQTNARWAIRLATDQVKLAEDKAAADAVKAAWDHTIDLDIIKVDQDKVKLAEDQLLLTEENLSLQAQVVDLLGGDSSGSLSQMPQILQQISGDQTAIATDQAAQQRDQQLAAQQEAAMALQTAYDQQQMARDQAAADAASAAGQMRLAQDGNKLAADQVAEQMQTNSLLSMSLSEMQQWNAGMLDALRNVRSGVDYHWVGSGPNPFETFINSAPASFSMNPSP